MLNLLHIENVAVIEKLDIEFKKGLNVLTGETGAGKSIVIDSLNAVLGGRITRELLRAGCARALITAVFGAEGVWQWCDANGIIPEEDGLVLQRTITSDGKSSCRVNGTPVPVSQLRELGGLLLDIHGQNDGRKLMDESRHRDYLDEFGALEAIRAEYLELYEKWRSTREEIERLTMDEIEKERLTENLRFQIEELEGARLCPGEFEELCSRREFLKNAVRLTEFVEGAYDAVYGGEYSAISLASEASRLLERCSQYGSELEITAKTISEALFLLEDAAERIRDFKNGLEFSPEEYDGIENRISKLKRLFKRYSAQEEELISKLADSKERLESIEVAGERRVILEHRIEGQRKDVYDAALKLREARKQASLTLEERLSRELCDLNMPSVRFRVMIGEQKEVEDYGPSGGDEVRFLMSANSGEEPGRISRIASGGELSRIMLAMKSVFSERDGAQAMVFDEIDAGVSGIAAQRVGEKLAELSTGRQILCVTHLPQIAAMADAHFAVEKSERNYRTYTSLLELDTQGRTRELARLHGGENITNNTLLSAGEQLKAAQEYKKRMVITKNDTIRGT